MLLARGSRPRQYLRKGGPVLGVEPDFIYREGTVALAPGDRLFLYTDGLTEQRDPQGRFFEADRLIALVEQAADCPPEQLLEHVFATVNAFGHQHRSDDQTAMLLHLNALPGDPESGP